MCADALNLQSEIEALDKLGVEYIHLDFMDNHFVPNITLSADLIKAVKSVLVNMKRDIHIMAYQPEQFFDRMDIGQGDIVAVHYEACDNLHEVITDIRQRGASPFVAISPDTKPDVLEDFLDEIDGEAVRKLLDSRREGILLEVDGHVSWDLCAEMRVCGGDMFVAGSSSLYQKGLDLAEAVERMRALIS